MDFGNLKRPTASKAPVDPIEIFRKTPNVDEAFNDLWAGQSTALEEWHKHRRLSDILVSLNTGAGKSIVGLLIAQSLVNEKAKVLYVCSTNDLIKQTEREAQKIGLTYSTRFSGKFSNDLYETERAFCITNYATVFSAFSPFRSAKTPTALIFDDAHVAEKAVRDAVTLTISRKYHLDLFNIVISIASSAFAEIGRSISLTQTLSDKNSAPLMAPPFAVSHNSSQLFQACNSYFTAAKDLGAQASVIALKELIGQSCLMISYGKIEISPPFIPPNLFPVLRSDDVRRIYLSATLKSKSDIVRTFGRQPKKIIEPSNDAGNGERLIIFHKYLPQNISGPSVVTRLAGANKVLVAVPTGVAAQKYKDCATIPTTERFSEELNVFRQKNAGAFALIYRVDGIDLPHKTCRIMLIENLPSGSSLLERFQLYDLNMQNLYNGRLANRLTQLFGRINRGRSDYGVFFLVGRDINNWLGTDRFVSLMPDLLQRQIMLGRNAVEGQPPKDIEDVVKLVDAVLSRNQGWLDYYRDWNGAEVDTRERDKAKTLEQGLVKISEAEVEYANCVFEGDFSAAKDSLLKISELASSLDAKIAGWHDLWIGHCYEILDQEEIAHEFYRRAKSRLSPRLPTRKAKCVIVTSGTEAPSTLVEAHLQEILMLEIREINDITAKIRANCSTAVDSSCSSSQCEEAVRTIGSLMGFVATRPDNEFGKGPDVLWLDAMSKIGIPLELKTNKKAPATYRKKDDVGQAHDSLQWLSEECAGYSIPAFIIVGPYGRCSKDAHPNEKMFLCSPERLVKIASDFIALIDDLKMKIPLERASYIKSVRMRAEWTTSGIISAFREFPLKTLKLEENTQ